MEIKILQDSIKKLQSIQDFPDLVKYLADELDWPIETDDFDEMTFEYSAEELGLDKKISPKFLDIRRLRPLDNDQPWGIFFIAFDETKLPVVALRRLLSKLVKKKRSSSNTGDHASWHSDDLLLISQTGSNDGKSISFAHFSSNPNKKDLPVLKVLGWDSDDTGLKIDHVSKMLREKLIWPENPADSDAWREQWRDAFTLKNREVIQSSKVMAERLGQLALAVRNRLRDVLSIETEKGPMHQLMLMFKEYLISDLNNESFSDMYAQTIAYGLLSARIINPNANTADAAHTQIPITNPFLKDLMEEFLNIGGRKNDGSLSIDFDELEINEVIDLLDNTNMEAVLRDFGDHNQKEDPVMHFFEGFLEEYDSQIRRDRGVFYTPQPVVSFIVRSVDERLRKEFGLEDGLADNTTWGELAERLEDLEIPEGISPDQAFVQILDPATGTGTFPVEVIDLIYKTMTAKWKLQGNREEQIINLWNDYVPKHLLPRLHGYELMMAPYAIAHMKIGLKLHETGYLFKSDQRARVYLTNALESSKDFSDTLAFAIPALAYEAELANSIKKNQCFTVVIGNPPYSISSQNKSPFIGSLMELYKLDIQHERNIKPLSDDYVKFFRFAHWIITNNTCGVVGLITNNSFFWGPTFLGMRARILEDFNIVDLVNLHGDSLSGETNPDVEKDENIFDIRQGVAVSLLVRSPYRIKDKSLRLADLYGSRLSKYKALTQGGRESIKLDEFPIKSTGAPFIIINTKNENEYLKYMPLDKILTVHSKPILTKRDHITIHHDRESLVTMLKDLIHLNQSEFSEKYNVGPDSGDWTYAAAKKTVTSLGIKDTFIKQIAYRPFDKRWTYYVNQKGFMARPVYSLLRNMIKPNLAVCVPRQVNQSDWCHAMVVNGLVEYCLISNRTREQNDVFPLYSYEESTAQQTLDFDNLRSTNFGDDFLKSLANLHGVTEISGNTMPDGLEPEDIFNYIYAILFSPTYRSRYAEFLKSGYPRIPIPNNLSFLLEIASFGKDLSKEHLMESSSLIHSITRVIGATGSQVESVSYSQDTVWINKARTQGFEGVKKDVWNFQIGGYQVCKKWLKDRQAKGGKNPHSGRVLTENDIEHFQKIVTTISETIRIMTEIDKAIENHGNWPNAFID